VRDGGRCVKRKNPFVHGENAQTGHPFAFEDMADFVVQVIFRLDRARSIA
jgi:hypothetical protein